MTIKHQDFLSSICDNRFVKWKRLIFIIGSLIMIVSGVAFVYGMNQGETTTEVKNLKSEVNIINNKLNMIESMDENIKDIKKILEENTCQ